MYQHEYERQLREKCRRWVYFTIGLPALLTYPIARAVVYLWDSLDTHLDKKIENYVKRKSEEAYRDK
jgi:hypothetical protein